MARIQFYDQDGTRIMIDEATGLSVSILAQGVDDGSDDVTIVRTPSGHTFVVEDSYDEALAKFNETPIPKRTR